MAPTVAAEAQAAGRSLAITTHHQRHATVVNHHIQNARLKAGALTGVPVAAADGEVFVGDVVMTRRNDRTLTTTSGGDAVRNRDRWIVSATHHDGSISECRVVLHAEAAQQRRSIIERGRTEPPCKLLAPSWRLPRNRSRMPFEVLVEVRAVDHQERTFGGRSDNTRNTSRPPQS